MIIIIINVISQVIRLNEQKHGWSRQTRFHYAKQPP